MRAALPETAAAAAARPALQSTIRLHEVLTSFLDVRIKSALLETLQDSRGSERIALHNLDVLVGDMVMQGQAYLSHEAWLALLEHGFLVHDDDVWSILVSFFQDPQTRVESAKEPGAWREGLTAASQWAVEEATKQSVVDELRAFLTDGLYEEVRNMCRWSSTCMAYVLCCCAQSIGRMGSREGRGQGQRERKHISTPPPHQLSSAINDTFIFLHHVHRYSLPADP